MGCSSGAAPDVPPVVQKLICTVANNPNAVDAITIELCDNLAGKLIPRDKCTDMIHRAIDVVKSHCPKPALQVAQLQRPICHLAARAAHHVPATNFLCKFKHFHIPMHKCHNVIKMKLQKLMVKCAQPSVLVV